MNSPEMTRQQHKRHEAKKRWQAHLRAWEASGLSIKAFCESRELHEWSFYYWKRPASRPCGHQRSATRQPCGHRHVSWCRGSLCGLFLR